MNSSGIQMSRKNTKTLSFVGVQETRTGPSVIEALIILDFVTQRAQKPTIRVCKDFILKRDRSSTILID